MSQKTTSYSPLPDSLTITKSKLHGLGLFATKHIDPGTDLGVTHVEDDRFLHSHIRTPLGGFINHSSQPNSILLKDDRDEDLLRLKTLKEVSAGEELTVNYMDHPPHYDEEILATFT